LQLFQLSFDDVCTWSMFFQLSPSVCWLVNGFHGVKICMSTDIGRTCAEHLARQTDGSFNENFLQKMKFH